MVPTLLLLAAVPQAEAPPSPAPRVVTMGVARARIVSASRLSFDASSAPPPAAARLQHRADRRVEIVFE